MLANAIPGALKGAMHEKMAKPKSSSIKDTDANQYKTEEFHVEPISREAECGNGSAGGKRRSDTEWSLFATTERQGWQNLGQNQRPRTKFSRRALQSLAQCRTGAHLAGRDRRCASNRRDHITLGYEVRR